ncbi:MAG TPA: hypothetical protein EYN91_02155 [Candidatus Melainabacteria bacterium]|nr:hypothetical protein [Candidatus Melainabacteria bacterium]HIN65463.1 hypothetical protein [Candidatus Obscuribacterales bacterium]
MRKTKRGHLPAMPQGRRQRGNMIALVGAICGGVLLALLLFALAYTRLLGGNQEQKTAIEAASIAAAKDLGCIVVKDDHFGWVSLSDYAPTGTLTKAPDGNYQPVYSINTILATIRLDMILGDQVSAVCGNPVSMNTWKYLADQDYNAAMTSKNNLTALLQNSLLPGGDPNAKDIQGNLVQPYTSAENAYKQNNVRQNGGSAYVNGSLKLTLGCLDGGSETTVKVPQPESKASLGGANTQNGRYMSYVNYPYNGKNFVFTGAGNSIKLVDAKKFKATLPLPYAIPAIVMAEADQKYFENGDTSKPARVIHTLACAQPACIPDPRPAPGLLTLDCPDNNWPAIIAHIADLLSRTQMLNNINPAEIFTTQGGDYNGPGSGGTLVGDGGSSFGSGSMPPASALAGAIYDWVRRGGNNVNIDSVVAFVNGTGLPGGKFNKNTLYKFVIDQNGVIQLSTTGAQKEPYLALSENQVYMDCGDALDEIDATTGNKKAPWALYMKDQVRDWGDVLGGQHAGQPIPVNGTYIASNPADKWIACLPSALPDSAIAMNGNVGTVKLGEYGVMGTGANHKNGGGTATTSLPVHNLDDFAEPGVLGLNFPGATGGSMPPQYLQNGAAVTIRFRVEEITTAGGGWSWGSAGLTEGHFKK